MAEAGEIIAMSRLSQLTGWSRDRIRKLIADGLPVHQQPKSRSDGWLFNSAKVFEWALAAGRGGTDGEDRPDAEYELALLRREQRETAALKNAALRGELLPAGEVLEGWQAAIGRARALLLGIPLAASRELVLLVRQHDEDDRAERAVRDRLGNDIDSALTELANTATDDDDDEQADEIDAPSGDEAVGAAAQA